MATTNPPIAAVTPNIAGKNNPNDAIPVPIDVVSLPKNPISPLLPDSAAPRFITAEPASNTTSLNFVKPSVMALTLEEIVAGVLVIDLNMLTKVDLTVVTVFAAPPRFFIDFEIWLMPTAIIPALPAKSTNCFAKFKSNPENLEIPSATKSTAAFHKLPTAFSIGVLF